jgi:type IV secretion system protein VirB9
MSISRVCGCLIAIALTVAACATTVRVPEIPILDGVPFKEASREADPKPSVKIVEVPKPLPLPGQLKPVPEKKDHKQPKEEKQPKDRVKKANVDARVEPAKDGYINAIQIYPDTGFIMHLAQFGFGKMRQCAWSWQPGRATCDRSRR